MPAGAVDDAWVEALEERFHDAHEAEYGHRFDAPIEIINIRVVGIGRVDELQPRAPSTPATATRPTRSLRSARSSSRSTAGAERHLTPFYERELLRAGDRLERPGDRRAVRHDDGDPAGPRRPRSTRTATS